MLKVLLFPLLLLATNASAQTDCEKPVIKLLRDGQEISVAAASALAPVVTLRVESAAGCPAQSYRFRHAEITLVRNGRPVLPTLIVEKPQVSLRDFADFYQAGDHLSVLIAYQNLALVAPGGTLTPLLAVRAAQLRANRLDLRPDDSKGISFKWKLTK